MDLNKLNRFSNKAKFVEELKRKAYDTEMKYHGCAQATMKPFLDIFEINNPAIVMAASPFAGGLALTGNNCGALLGGLIVLGLLFGRKDYEEGLEGIVAGVRPMRKLMKYFEGKYRSVNCRDLTQTDVADPVKAVEYFEEDGGLKSCAEMIAEVAGFVGELLYEEKITREKF